MPRGAAPTPHARHPLPPLSADLPRHPRGTGGSRPAGQPVLPWGTGSPRGRHHLHREVQPGGVVRHALCGERRPRSVGTRRCRGATGPHPCRPVTVKHLAQLLPDEPLDLVVIHHIPLGTHGRGHRHQALWGDPMLQPPLLTIIPGGPGSPGLPAGPGEPGGPLSPAGPRGPTSPMEPLFPGPPGMPALPFSPG